MSKPIPEEEYNRKPLTKLIQWVRGEKDPYLGNVESQEQRPFVPNERLVRMHKQELLSSATISISLCEK